MSTSMTLLELRTATRQRADMVNSQFVSDSELTSYINQSAFELYDLMIQKYGNDYFVAAPAQFNTDGASQVYALPDGISTAFTNGFTGAASYQAPRFYKLLGVDLNLQPGNPSSYVTIRKFDFADRNRYSVPNFQSFYGITNLRYRLQGNNLWLTPIPAANQVIQVWYVPIMVTLSADGDLFQGYSGWTEYIICDAAMKCLQKEESDVSVLMAEKQALIQRLEAAAENRDAANPQRVADTQGGDYWWGSGSGDGGGSGGSV